MLNCSYRLAANRPGCVSFGNWPNVDACGQSANVDEAVIRGAEFATRFPIARGWAGSANYTYTDGEQKSGPNAGKPLGDYKGYTQLHLGTRYQLTKRVTINAAIYNLLNKDFVDYRSYRAPGAVNPTWSSVYVNNMDGRRLWLSASADF